MGIVSTTYAAAATPKPLTPNGSHGDDKGYCMGEEGVFRL